MERLNHSVRFKFLNDYNTFYRHQKTSDEVTTTREITADGLPSVRFPEGVVLPEKKNGNPPEEFTCPILTDFIMMRSSNQLPDHFLRDVDVFTTLSALRSLICQWVDEWSHKSIFFKKNPHFCQLDDSDVLFLNTATNYTVPLEKSTAFLNRFTMLEHRQTWKEFCATSYSGIAKIRLSNGTRVAFTYKMYAQIDNQPIDIIIRSASAFEREAEFHFLNCFLTRKKLWRYEIHRNRTTFREELSARDIWDILPIEKQQKITDSFAHRLPIFLVHVTNGILREDEVNVIEDVTGPVRLTPRNSKETLF